MQYCSAKDARAHELTRLRKRFGNFDDLMPEKIQETSGICAQSPLIDESVKNGTALKEKETAESPRPPLSETERVKHLVLVELEEDSGISDSAIEEIALIDNESEEQPVIEHEGVLTLIFQVFIPFLIAGFGMMLAGMLLDHVQHWEVFMDVDELFILVPALLGLKGNLEMTLASRLSTAANLGVMNSCKSRWRLTWGNLSLVQGQALVVASLATLLSIALGMIGGTPPGWIDVLLIGGSSMSAACLASALLGSLMVVIVIVSRPLNINPDNVATPIAASLGDLVTLSFLSFIAHGLYSVKSETMAISGVLCAVLLVLIPLWLCLAYCNTTTRSVLYSGWIPVLSAMAISSLGGFVLSKTVGDFPGIAVFSPIINGVGGNLVAVQASRISTFLHRVGDLGRKPPSTEYQWRGILRTFWGSHHARMARLLLLMVIPGSALFLLLIRYANAGHTTLSPMFFISYIMVAVTQVSLLLVVADWMVHFIFWRLKFDPDNIAIPFLTALGDLLGTGLLSLAFQILYYLGDRDSDVGE